MITKTDYAGYKNISKEEISVIEHFLKWTLGGRGYDNSFGVIEFLDKQFPEENFLVLPSIDSSTQIPTKKVFIQKL